jgi:hypothetical protein
MVVTDHYIERFYTLWFPEEVEGLTHEEQVTRWLKGFRTAREEGEKIGFTVLPGTEVRFDNYPNDYLIYGLTREEAKAYKLTEGSLKELSDYVRSCGGVIIQAHPMREEMTIVPPKYVDGYELYNNSKDWIYTNPIVQVWAAINCFDQIKILTAGNDHHNPSDDISAGILTKEPIVTNEDLVRTLNTKDFTIFHGTKLNCGY